MTCQKWCIIQHEGAYYKTSRGKEGIKHYDLHGNEKQ